MESWSWRWCLLEKLGQLGQLGRGFTFELLIRGGRVEGGRVSANGDVRAIN